MTKISKRPLKKDVEKRMMDIFGKTIASMNDAKDIDSFLDEFLFPVEKVMLAKRLAVAVLLIKGYTYPIIISALSVSPPTIAAVSLNLKYKSGTYKKVLEKLLKDEKFMDVLGGIGDVVESVIPPRGFDPEYIKTNLDRNRKKRNKPL